ncbi:MAG: hypothetical protein RIA65_16600 [Woeseia sp.]
MRSISPRLFTFACVLLIWALWSLAAEPPGQAADQPVSGTEQSIEQGAEQAIEQGIVIVE